MLKREKINSTQDLEDLQAHTEQELIFFLKKKENFDK